MNLLNTLRSIADTIKAENAVYRQTPINLKAMGSVTVALSVVSIVMSHMNYVHAQYEMLAATLILTAALIFTFIFSHKTKNKVVSDFLFCIIISALCFYFAVTGGNDGFAILWVLLFVPFTMLIMGFRYGISIGLFFEAFFIGLFWTPLNQTVSEYYSQTFMLRFPMLFTAFFILSFIAKVYIVKMGVAEYKALSANEAKTEFLSRVSHELRTPLNVILGMAKLGLEDERVEESIDRFEKIIFSSTHLSNIITDVLEMSRMESGRTEIKKGPVRLKPTVQECAELFSLQAREKGIAFTCKVDAGLPEVLLSDEFRIRQILINLLSNAVKFTDEGSVSLDVTLAERSGAKCTVLFSIADTGIGMSEEFTAKVFTPFEQEDSFLSRRYEGSGLGLAISHNLVELMGGRMEVESRLGEGSRFFYTLPFDIAEPEKAPEEDSGPGEEISFEGKRFLIVDDFEVNRIIAKQVFIKTGAIFEEACDGDEAYQKFLGSPAGYYDCILMDIQMPNMDGYAATAAIRASGRPDSGLPITAVTANALKEDVDASIAAGLNDHVAKPIDFDECRRKAAYWCKKLNS